MNADNTTKRRALLKAAPAAIAPGVGIASATNPRGWQDAKGAFSRALEAVNAAMKAEDGAERAAWAFKETAPTQTFIYTEPAMDRGWLRTDAYEASITLDHNNWSKWSETLRCDPEYAAFGERVLIWQNEPAHVEACNRLKALREDLGAAHRAEHKAWRRMASFPTRDAAISAEKIAISRPHLECDEERMAELFGYLEADLKRIAALA